MTFRKEPLVYYDEPDRRVVDLRPFGVSFVPLASRTICRYTRKGPSLHVHGGCSELVYCVRGDLSFETPDGAYPFLPGSVFVSGPDQPHALSRNSKGAFVYRLLVACPRRGASLQGLSASETAVIVEMLRNPEQRLFAAALEMRGLFERLFGLLDRSDIGNVERAIAIRLCVLEILVVSAIAAKRAPERTILPVISRWMKRMAENPEAEYDLSAMASEARLTPAVFRKKFQLASGLPPRSFLKKCRIRRAEDLLKAGRMSISCIADRLGFSSTQHFTTRFKQETGLTPGDFRINTTKGDKAK